MRTGITFDVTAADRSRLEAIIAAPTSPQKHVWRAKIILMSGNGLGTVAIMQATGKSKPCVWRWQERFMSEGVVGLLRDKSRPPGMAPLESDVVEQVVALTLEPPRQEATHWTVRAMANAVGIAASSVVKIWHEHGLAPHRWRSFKLSNDKAFAEKLHRRVVRLDQYPRLPDRPGPKAVWDISDIAPLDPSWGTDVMGSLDTEYVGPMLWVTGNLPFPYNQQGN